MITNILIIIILLLIGIAGDVLLYSDTGTQIVFNLITKKNPEISYERVSGKLLGKLEISKLKYHSDMLDLEIDHLTTKNSFNPFWLKLVIQELTVENVTLRPRLPHIKKGSSATFHLPFGIEANKITLKNTQLKNDKNLNLQLPTLIGSLNITRKNLNLLFYKENDEGFFLKLDQGKKLLQVNLHAAINKTDCKVHYYATKKRYAVNSEIFDAHQGKLLVNGSGEGTSHLLHINADNFHLNHFVQTDWAGVMSFNLQAQHDKKNTEVKLENLKGIIHGQPIKGNGELRLNNNLISQLDINVISNNSKIEILQPKNLPGQIGWILKIPELHYFLPNANGEVLARGVLTDLFTKPTINTEFRVNNFVFKQYKLKTLILQAMGGLKYHDIKIALGAKGQTAVMHLIGKYDAQKWKGIINQFDITNNKQQWRLEKKTDVNINKYHVAMNPLSLVGNQGHLVVNGVYQFGRSLKGKMEVRNFDLSLIDFLLPDDFRIDGKMNLSATADFNKKKKLNIAAELSPGIIYYQIHDPEKSIYNGGKFKAFMKDDNLISSLSLSFPEGEFTSSIKLPHLKLSKQKNQPVEGTLHVHFAQTKILEMLIPAIKNVSGRITGDYTLSGILSHPNLSGELNLSQGSLQIPKLNLKVMDVNLNAKSANNIILYRGHLTSGNGTLFLNGQTKIEHGAFPIDLDLHGTNILVCNQPEIKIFASPTMHLQIVDKTLKLSGKILIPEANIHPHDFGNTETASDDIIFIQADGKKVESSSLRMVNSIQLKLGDKIYLNSRGIKGQVRGQLQIEDDPNKATVANGELWLQDGNYTIYGKTLEINNGRLLFTGGPLSNPGLNIKASRSLQAKTNTLFSGEETIKVGVQVTGTLHEPKINLFSEPAGKSSADILSYLVLGMPLNSLNQSASKSNTQLLLQAADALNVSGNNRLLNIKDQLKKGLGLAELDIGTQSEIDPHTQETIQHTAFVLGKYLSPKFYVNYSLDLFDHTNTLKVRYLLNKFWTVQSVANTNGSGVDILYTVEK